MDTWEVLVQNIIIKNNCKNNTNNNIVLSIKVVLNEIIKCDLKN